MRSSSNGARSGTSWRMIGGVVKGCSSSSLSLLLLDATASVVAMSSTSQSTKARQVDAPFVLELSFGCVLLSSSCGGDGGAMMMLFVSISLLVQLSLCCGGLLIEAAAGGGGEEVKECWVSI
eukprot:scaffold1371_cov111-Skeletonema_marinoi.AAC.1